MKCPRSGNNVKVDCQQLRMARDHTKLTAKSDKIYQSQYSSTVVTQLYLLNVFE